MHARSDLLGVALGTAALEIAKAGLGVDPAFWPLDAIAIVLGCLLGVFLPVIRKHRRLLADPPRRKFMSYASITLVASLFAAVFFAGIPDYIRGCVISSIFLFLTSLLVFAGILYARYRGNNTNDANTFIQNAHSERLSPGALLTPNESENLLKTTTTI